MLTTYPEQNILEVGLGFWDCFFFVGIELWNFFSSPRLGWGLAVVLVLLLCVCSKLVAIGIILFWCTLMLGHWLLGLSIVGLGSRDYIDWLIVSSNASVELAGNFTVKSFYFLDHLLILALIGGDVFTVQTLKGLSVHWLEVNYLWC